MHPHRATCRSRARMTHGQSKITKGFSVATVSTCISLMASYAEVNQRNRGAKTRDGTNDWGGRFQSPNTCGPELQESHLHELFSARNFVVTEMEVEAWKRGGMSLIGPTPESTVLPELRSEQTSTTSETMATMMKAKPMGIVLHHTNAYGFQLGVGFVGWTDSSDFDIPREWGFESLEGTAAKRQHDDDQRGASEQALTGFGGHR